VATTWRPCLPSCDVTARRRRDRPNRLVGQTLLIDGSVRRYTNPRLPLPVPLPVVIIVIVIIIILLINNQNNNNNNKHGHRYLMNNTEEIVCSDDNTAYLSDCSDDTELKTVF